MRPEGLNQGVAARKAVLVVDENRAEADLLAESLRKRGIVADIVSFVALEDVYEFLKEAKGEPRVTFLDLQVSSGEPLKALKDWKERFGSQSLFVVLTDDARGSALQQAYASGADSFLVKPLAEKDLDHLMTFYRQFFTELH